MPADGGMQGGMMPADGGGGYGGGGYQPNVHVSVGTGMVAKGPGYVVGEQQSGPSTVTQTYVGDGGSSMPVGKGPIICCLSVVAALIVYMMMAGMQSDIHVTANQHRWEFEIHTEIFTVLHDEGWGSPPMDSYNRMCQLRRHGGHYGHTPIGRTCHTEHTTRHDCSTSNGVQTCVNTPVDRRVCNNIYQWYVDYDTYCTYNVMRWVRAPASPAISSGVGMSPYWPYAPITNCGGLGCTRLHRTIQNFYVDFTITDGHSAGSQDTCTWHDTGMWGWIQDSAQYQAKADHFGSNIICPTLQTPQAAPPPSDFQFQPRGGNSTYVPPQYVPAPAPPAPPAYASGSEWTGGSMPQPAPAPAPPGVFLAEKPGDVTITELNEAELAELDAAALEAPADDEVTE